MKVIGYGQFGLWGGFCIPSWDFFRGGVQVISFSSFGTLVYLLFISALSRLMLCLELWVQLWTWKMNKFIRPSDNQLKEEKQELQPEAQQRRERRDEEMRRRTRRGKGKEWCAVKICCCRGLKANDGKLQSDATPWLTRSRPQKLRRREGKWWGWWEWQENGLEDNLEESMASEWRNDNARPD